MKNFMQGINNFFVGLFVGLLTPVLIIAVLLFMTVDKLTHFTQQQAMAPLMQQAEQTLNRIDTLVMNVDGKVSAVELEDLQQLSPFKDAKILPELKQVASSIQQVKQNIDQQDVDVVLLHLQHQLEQSLSEKLSEQQAHEVAQSLTQLAAAFMPLKPLPDPSLAE